MTTGDIINTNDPRLERVRDAGKKILMWQGTADQLITAENGLEYYTRIAAHFAGGTPEFSVLQPWFRYFRASWRRALRRRAGATAGIRRACSSRW